MNPETNDTVPALQAADSPTRTRSATTTATATLAASTSTSSFRKSQVFQRRLKEKISESRALELLDRRIKGDRRVLSEDIALDESNQDQDDELVCDSTMVRFDASPEEPAEPRACGVLKTVRGIHRQRERERLPTTPHVPDQPENQ